MAIVNEHYGKDNISHDLLPLAQRFTRSLEDRSKDDFMHGSVVCYHDFGSMDNWFFKPQDNEHPAKHRQATHANLKEEILNSTIQSISMDICTKYMNKANAYLKYSNTVKRIRSSDRTSCTAHHVQINAPMSIQHVLSVILWCDNDGALSNALCNAFKTQHAEDNHYHHWSTYLLQAVQCFGDSLSTKQRFYHCVIPIPTDHDYNGVVLELQEHLSDINNAFRYLDCSIFSSRSNTDETLFFGGLYPLKICNVNDRTNRSFKPLIDTPALLKQVIQGQPYDRRTPNTVNLIERLSTKDKTLPEYARRIFECFCDAREESVIDLTHLNLDYPLLKEYLLSPEDVLYVSKLTAMFQNCARVKIVNDTNKVCISSLYLTQLRIEMTNEDNERVFEQSSLKELSYMNVLLDDKEYEMTSSKLKTKKDLLKEHPNSKSPALDMYTHENVNHNCNGNDDDNNGDKNKRNRWQQREQEHAQDQEEEEEEEKMMETLQEDQDMEFESDFIFGDRVTIDKDLNDIFAELSLEKEFSDILSTANPLPALQTLPSTSSHGTTASHTTHGHSPNAKTKKRKTKKRKKLKKSERNSGASYNPNPLYRAQGNIQISKQFTAEMIPCEITESITNLYGFMDKCTALCLMEERQDHEEDVLRIFNYGFHSKHSNETLYCVVQRQDVAVNASRGYKWKMLTKLYTMQAIAHEFGIHKAPKSLYDTVLYKSYLIQQQRIVSVISNVDSMRNLINNTQWHRIDIFNKVNNKRRMHLFLTKPEFMKECRQFVVNHWKSNALSFDLIPILMFNDECNEYWIEHVWIIRIDEEDISIGISFKYTINNQVKVAGIHLDKELLIDQHQLIVPNHECHCLDAFESNINYLSIGNPDDSLNKIKYYKQQIEELTKCKEQLQEQQQYHRYHINNHIHNEQMFKM
eukprot:1012897_1